VQSSAVILDATQFGGTGTGDACDRISQAINQLLTVANGVVDARGFTGNQYCAESMFPVQSGMGTTTIPTGKLLLGNAVFWVSSTQIQPTKFQVEGVGWTNLHNGTPAVSNTVIRACPTNHTGTPCLATLTAQSPATVPIVWCWGGGTGRVAHSSRSLA